MFKIFFSILILLSSCKSGIDYTTAENGLDAGREFIDACLKGDFKKANYYMLQDATNTQQLSELQKDYEQRSADDKKNYYDASIEIANDESVNDSTEVISYKNSFDKIARKLKVVSSNGKWLVDFKYTSSGNL